jgi:hypothetical protein
VFTQFDKFIAKALICALLVQNVAVAAPSAAMLWCKIQWSICPNAGELKTVTVEASKVVHIGSHELVVGTTIYDFIELQHIGPRISFVGEVDGMEMSAEKYLSIASKSKNFESILKQNFAKLLLYTAHSQLRLASLSTHAEVYYPSLDARKCPAFYVAIERPPIC